MANGPRLQQLRAAIVSCTQHQQMSIEEYYTRLMALYDELNRLLPSPSCGCSQCLCDVNGKLAAAREEEILHQFFIGLDDDLYGTIRSNLLSHSPRQLWIRLIKRLFKKSVLEILINITSSCKQLRQKATTTPTRSKAQVVGRDRHFASSDFTPGRTFLSTHKNFPRT